MKNSSVNKPFEQKLKVISPNLLAVTFGFHFFSIFVLLNLWQGERKGFIMQVNTELKNKITNNN